MRGSSLRQQVRLFFSAALVAIVAAALPATAAQAKPDRIVFDKYADGSGIYTAGH